MEITESLVLSCAQKGSYYTAIVTLSEAKGLFVMLNLFQHLFQILK